MKCPHCEYIDSVISEDGWDLIMGDKGKFFSLSGEGMMSRPCSPSHMFMYAGKERIND